MTFWDFMLFFFIVVPITIAWFTSIVDLFGRRDLSGWVKAAWLIGLLVLPILGCLIYLITRPQEATGAWNSAGYSSTQGYESTGMGTASELETLSRLKTEGALSAEEYEAAKSRVLTKAA